MTNDMTGANAELLAEARRLRKELADKCVELDTVQMNLDETREVLGERAHRAEVERDEWKARALSLRDHLDLALRAWHYKAHQGGDGFEARHADLYDAAKRALEGARGLDEGRGGEAPAGGACGYPIGERSCQRDEGHGGLHMAIDNE